MSDMSDKEKTRRKWTSNCDYRNNYDKIFKQNDKTPEIEPEEKQSCPQELLDIAEGYAKQVLEFKLLGKFHKADTRRHEFGQFVDNNKQFAGEIMDHYFDTFKKLISNHITEL